MEEFLKSLNPQNDDQLILIYGSKYKLWRGGKYLGVATWTKDDNVGDSFQSSYNDNGEVIIDVYIADRWELILNSLNH